MSDDLLPDEYEFTELWNEAEYRACRTDSLVPDDQLEAFLHFCENYVYIRHPEGGRISFAPSDAQIEAVRTWMSNRQSITLKARQIGFSTIIAIYVLWLTAFYRDRQVILISIGEREAIKLLQKVKYAYRFLPDWMKERFGPIGQTQSKFTFDGMASEIESIPSSQPARGDSAYLIVCDELAHLKNAEEAYTAIEPAADVGGRIVMLSTAYGEGNLFHRLWVGAQAGTNDYHPMFFGWDSLGRDKEWYEAKANSSDMDEAKMAQEYPDNPEDAFLKSGRPVFNLPGLRQLDTRPPIATGYFNEHGEFVRDDLADLPESEGVSVWEPPSEDEVYAIGVDVSQGLEHGDFSSAHVIACRKRKLVATYHGHIDPDILGKTLLPALGRWYRNALIGVESNSFGLTTLKYLANVAKYNPIYYERSPKYKKSVPTDVLGFRTTQTTKPMIIGELKEALRTREVGDGVYVSELDMPCEKTLQELKTFVLNGKGRMAGSPFDDRTMSLAIANHMRKFVFLEEFTPERGPKPGTFGWWEKRLYGESFSELTSDQGPVRIGQGPKPKPIGQQYVRARSKFPV